LKNQERYGTSSASDFSNQHHFQKMLLDAYWQKYSGFIFQILFSLFPPINPIRTAMISDEKF